jgi:CRP-like cAMP-binding protein
MPSPLHSPSANHLLSLLPSNEFETIKDTLEWVALRQGETLISAHHEIDHVYFLCEGIASLVTVATEGQSAQAGMCGREGFTPTSAGVGGTVSVHKVMMQMNGSGYRMESAALQSALMACPVFEALLARYIQTFATQISYTALSNANYHVDVRLARWLLMSHDRVDGDELALTHEFISLMLSVRRPSVTTALHVLEGRRLVLSERGRITIRDRRRLEAFAGDCYGKPEAEYRNLIGPL